MLILASDHAGFELKQFLNKFFILNGIAFIDAGALDYDPDDDYPDFDSYDEDDSEEEEEDDDYPDFDSYDEDDYEDEYGDSSIANMQPLSRPNSFPTSASNGVSQPQVVQRPKPAKETVVADKTIDAVNNIFNKLFNR